VRAVAEIYPQLRLLAKSLQPTHNRNKLAKKRDTVPQSGTIQKDERSRGRSC